MQSTWQLPNIIPRQYANELSAPRFGGSRWCVPDPSKLSKGTNVKQENEGQEIRAESSEIMRSITPFEKEEKPQEEVAKRKLTEKEKLNDPIVIAKGSRRAIRHETLERDNDLH